MSDTFITSDEHYGHQNIIKFCKRPFADTREMQEELIRRHNAKVPNPEFLDDSSRGYSGEASP